MEQPSRRMAAFILILIAVSFAISKVAFAMQQEDAATENVGTTRVDTVEETIKTIEEPATEMTEATTVATTVDETVKATTVAATTADESWDGPVLNRINGTVKGPSGKETYYNLNMSGVISIMRDLGYDDEYWVRDDGVKMFGNYVMCAANLKLHPRGSLVETSLGTAIVCDTGSFAKTNPHQLDIAVSW